MATPSVFLSYAHRDSAVADRVRRKLRGLPIEVWSDEQLAAGSEWGPALRRRLRASDAVLVIVTPSAFDSDWVMQELGAAWALGKPIFSIASDLQLLDKLPVRLDGRRAVNADDLDGLEELIREVRAPAA